MSRTTGRHWLLVIAGIAAVGAIAAVVALWHLPDRMYPAGSPPQGSAGNPAQARATLQSGLLTVAGALMVAAGGLVALHETRRANGNAHVRDLYVEAVKLLNDIEVGNRLAGVYAFERIATDSAADQRTVVEFLSTFVRTRSSSSELRSQIPAKPAADVHAAMTVLARLPVRKGVPRAHLSGANLTSGATVRYLHAPGGSLRRVRLGEADLRRAELDRADLSHAVLDNAMLQGAWLRGANLSSADLSGAHLAGADLTMAKLVGTILHGVDLSEVVGLKWKRVKVARGNERTRLPDGMKRPNSWPPYDQPPDQPTEGPRPAPPRPAGPADAASA